MFLLHILVGAFDDGPRLLRFDQIMAACIETSSRIDDFFSLTMIQTIDRTKDNVVKKQALTYEEIEAEREEVSSIIRSSQKLRI